MAVLASNGQDPNDQDNGSASSTTGGSGTITNSTGQPMSIGGGTGAPGTNASNASSGASTSANRGNPSGAPNVQDYLNANQNAGQNLSNGITNNVQNQANQVTSQVNSNENSLNNQYNPLNTTLSGGQSAANTAFQDPQALLTAYQNAQAQSTQGAAYTGAAPVASDLAAYNAFQGDVAGTGQYQANQQAIQNYNTTGQQYYNQDETALNNLGQTTSSAANQMGQNQLLQNTVGNPNYNQGQQTLDSLFLQGQGNQLQSNLSNIQNNTAQNVTNDNTDYQSKLSALQNLANQNTSYATNLFLNGPTSSSSNTTSTSQPQGLNQINATVQNQYNTDVANAAQTNTDIQNYLSGNGPASPDVLSALGLTSGENTWGLTPQQLGQDASYSANTMAAYNSGGAAQAATAYQFARYNALNQLAGGTAGALQPSIFGSATTAGGFTPYTIGNPNAIQNEITSNAQQYGITDVNNYLNQLSNLTNPSGGASGSFNVAQNPYYAPLNNALQKLESTSSNANPSDYYQQALSSIQGVLGNEYTPMLQSQNSEIGQIIRQLLNYGNGTLAPISQQKINSIAATLPAGSGGPQVINIPGSQQT